MYNLNDKVAIVTGGAKGIGAAAVRSFLDEGAKFVAFIDTDEKSGLLFEEELIKAHDRSTFKFFKCDVTKDEELYDVFNYTIKHYYYIDLVLNNAGIGNDVLFRKEIEINFTAVVTSTLKALDMMRKDRGGRGGTIINVSSIGALCIQKEPTIFVYCATKSAVLMLSAQLGMEAYYSVTGVRVITMCFGKTSTSILDTVQCIDNFSTRTIRDTLEASPAQTPEAAANGIVEAFKQGETGTIWLVAEDQITNITERVLKGYQVISGEIEM